jgi:hypothetical protein
LIGQNATLLGWVMPVPIDESVPLISNSQEDFDVVRELLTEHYAAFEKNLDEDEHDDTDPTQKDFLFGALLHEVGAILRSDTRLMTVRLAVELGAYKASWLTRKVVRLGLAIRDRFFAWPAARVGDCYVALNHGLDHLIQYLYMSVPGDLEKGLLTARANPPQLFSTSKEIIEAVGRTAPDAKDRHIFGATPRSRIEQLAALFYAPIAPRTGRAVRALAVAGVLLVAGLATAHAAIKALDYDPVYQQRMREMTARASEAQGGVDGGTSP